MTNKEDFKIATEKLLNTLGRDMGIKYYGFDTEYEVAGIVDYNTGKEITDFDLNDYENYTVIVKSKKPLPEIFVHQDTETGLVLAGHILHQTWRLWW